MSAVIGVFCRRPEAGRVKTRLAAAIGAEAAARLYAAWLEDTIDAVQGLADRVVLDYTPDDEASRRSFERLVRPGVELWPQPAGDLGGRLAAFFHSPGVRTAGRALVIGSDSPTLPREFVTTAVAKLNRCDVVLGPATDGGYYLLGLANPANPQPQWPDALFSGIDWSGPNVLAQTVDRAAAAGRSCDLLPPWYDVDTAAELSTLRANLAALQMAGVACPAPRTAAAAADL